MEIKILGSNCQKCKKLYSLIEEIIKEYNLNFNIKKVEDIVN